MRDFFISLLVFLCSLVIVLFFVTYVVSPRSIVQFIALMLVVILITISLFYHVFVSRKFKWFLLFLITLLVQLLVVSTGGLYSPFLILFHFLALGISLLFSLNTSLLFVLFSLFVLIGSVLFDNTALFLWQEDPAAAILYSISFLSLIPIAQLLAHKYKIKDTIVAMLTNQIEVEESMIAELNELVFVTDTDSNILSVNDAAEQILHKSKAELLHQPLFNVLFLRDKDGMVLNRDTLELDAILKEKTTKNISGISLLAGSSVNNAKVGMHIKPITGLTGMVDQITFIISGTAQMASDVHKNLEEASVRHNAMIEVLKKKLFLKESEDFYIFVLISKAEKDILNVRTIDDHFIEEKKAPFDIAILCKEAVVSEQDFARALHVPLQFALPNFGKKDIAPLITSLFPIAPEKLTGPFFTAYCEVTYLSLAIQKLLDVAVLLASSEIHPSVQLSVERQGDTALMISIAAIVPQIALQEREDVFAMYYGALANETNLSLGSGLEGYLAKRITDTLNIPLKIVTDEDQNRIAFLLQINKERK